MLPVCRLVAKMPGRNEPITYWIVIGESVMADTAKRKLMKVMHGLGGRIEDGMLVHISSIEFDEAAACQRHARFLRDLATHAPAESRVQVFGRP